MIPKDAWELDRQRIKLESNVGGGAFGSVSVALLAPGRVAGNSRVEQNFIKVAVKTVKGMYTTVSVVLILNVNLAPYIYVLVVRVRIQTRRQAMKR